MVTPADFQTLIIHLPAKRARRRFQVRKNRVSFFRINRIVPPVPLQIQPNSRHDRPIQSILLDQIVILRFQQLIRVPQTRLRIDPVQIRLQTNRPSILHPVEIRLLPQQTEQLAVAMNILPKNLRHRVPIIPGRRTHRLHQLQPRSMRPPKNIELLHLDSRPQHLVTPVPEKQIHIHLLAFPQVVNHVPRLLVHRLQFRIHPIKNPQPRQPRPSAVHLYPVQRIPAAEIDPSPQNRFPRFLLAPKNNLPHLDIRPRQDRERQIHQHPLLHRFPTHHLDRHLRVRISAPIKIPPQSLRVILRPNPRKRLPVQMPRVHLVLLPGQRQKRPYLPDQRARPLRNPHNHIDFPRLMILLRFRRRHLRFLITVPNQHLAQIRQTLLQSARRKNPRFLRPEQKPRRHEILRRRLLLQHRQSREIQFPVIIKNARIDLVFHPRRPQRTRQHRQQLVIPLKHLLAPVLQRHRRRERRSQIPILLHPRHQNHRPILDLIRVQKLHVAAPVGQNIQRPRQRPAPQKPVSAHLDLRRLRPLLLLRPNRRHPANRQPENNDRQASKKPSPHSAQTSHRV